MSLLLDSSNSCISPHPTPLTTPTECLSSPYVPPPSPRRHTHTVLHHTTTLFMRAVDPHGRVLSCVYRCVQIDQWVEFAHSDAIPADIAAFLAKNGPVMRTLSNMGIVYSLKQQEVDVTPGWCCFCCHCSWLLPRCRCSGRWFALVLLPPFLARSCCLCAAVSV